MRIPKILETRMLTKMMPEKELLNAAIEALITYRDGNTSEPEETKDNLSLKDKLFGKKEENTPKKKSHDEAAAKTIALLVKWVDEDRSMEEIIASSAHLENMLKNSSNG